MKYNWKRTIGLFMFGQGVTLFGSMLVQYAITWHITLTTKSSVMMMLVTMASALPMFFISPFGGVWADRYNKKKIINIADGVIALVTLVMALTFSAGFDLSGLLILCIVIRALGQGVQTPAVNSLIPDLVPKEHLTRVNGINSAVQSLVMFASPMAGGALLAFAPIQSLMYIDVITAVVGIAILSFFVDASKKKSATKTGGGAKAHFSEIKEGIRYVGKNAFLKKCLLLSALFSVMAAPAAVLTPLQVARDWGSDNWQLFGGMSYGPEQRLASMEIVFFVGMILGGIIIAAWGGFKNKSHTMALAVFVLGVAAVGLGVSTNFWLYLVCMGFFGILMNMFNSPIMAVLQGNVDPEYMGRVFSVLTMMSSIMMPLGMLVWGPLGDLVAIDYLLIVSGIAIFFMGFIFMLDKVLLTACAPGIEDDGGGS